MEAERKCPSGQISRFRKINPRFMVDTQRLPDIPRDQVGDRTVKAKDPQRDNAEVFFRSPEDDRHNR